MDLIKASRYCFDDRHSHPCQLPCLQCDTECDPKKRGIAKPDPMKYNELVIVCGEFVPGGVRHGPGPQNPLVDTGANEGEEYEGCANCQEARGMHT